MTREQLDLIFKSLRWSVPKLLECEDRRAELELKLSGEVSSPKLGLVGGITLPLYHNKQIAVKEDLDFLIVERDYHLHIVRTAAKYLQRIKSEDDLKILELYYWYGKTHQTIAIAFNVDKSVMTRRINAIIDNLHQGA